MKYIRINNELVKMTDKQYEEYIESQKTEPTYADLRVEKGYKSIPEQLDMLYWDKVNGTDLWKEHIDSVKAEFPIGG